VHDYADNMVHDHTDAGQRLTAVAGRAGLDVPATSRKDVDKGLDALRKKAGADFDKAYVRQMLRDHERTVALFRAASDRAESPDLRSFAAELLPTLEHHLGMARELEESVTGRSPHAK